jgi:hypothetical protein
MSTEAEISMTTCLVLSLEPSSTTITSAGVALWPMTERSALDKSRSRL